MDFSKFENAFLAETRRLMSAVDTCFVSFGHFRISRFSEMQTITNHNTVHAGTVPAETRRFTDSSRRSEDVRFSALTVSVTKSCTRLLYRHKIYDTDRDRDKPVDSPPLTRFSAINFDWNDFFAALTTHNCAS